MKGILFKPEMNLAIRERRKTVTRRIDASLKEINQHPDEWKVLPFKHPLTKTFAKGAVMFLQKEHALDGHPVIVKPRYLPGETVYVKEAHWRWGHWLMTGMKANGKPEWTFHPDSGDVHYSEDRPKDNVRRHSEKTATGWFKISPLFFPEKFARTFLLIKDVRPERLQEISQDDVLAEGVSQHTATFLGLAAPESEEEFNLTFARRTYQALWDSINTKPGTRWADNPYVWRIEFEVKP